MNNLRPLFYSPPPLDVHAIAVDVRHRQKNTGIYVVETQPQQRTIRYEGTYYRLVFPYIQWGIVFDEYKEGLDFKHLLVTANFTPVTSIECIIEWLTLPNISCSSVCMGDSYHIAYKKTPDELIKKAISDFWTSEFNSENPGAASWHLKNWQVSGKMPEMHLSVPRLFKDNFLRKSVDPYKSVWRYYEGKFLGD